MNKFEQVSSDGHWMSLAGGRVGTHFSCPKEGEGSGMRGRDRGRARSKGRETGKDNGEGCYG